MDHSGYFIERIVVVVVVVVVVVIVVVVVVVVVVKGKLLVAQPRMSFGPFIEALLEPFLICGTRWTVA
jgi:hypothetical protein